MTYGIKNAVSRYLRDCIEGKVFPGCVAGIISGGSTLFISEGCCTYESNSMAVDEDTVYDVASITKSVPTACLALKLIEEGILKETSLLVDFIPEFKGAFRKEISIKHLLSHTLEFDFRLFDKKNLEPVQILESIFKARLRNPPGAVFSYANATSVLLGIVVERAAGENLERAARSMFFDPLGMNNTTFFPEKLAHAVIAPSEDDPWRGGIICGNVHDESAWALRPLMAVGSAGLFSTASDMLKFLSMLLNGGASANGRIFKGETVRLMHENALPKCLGATAALGWELDRVDFMGNKRSRFAFGKTGFTGCALVADPLRRTGFVMMANHTYPRRRESRASINAARSGLADLIFGYSL